MGIAKGEAFTIRDVFIDYDFEDVMFRWDHVNRRIYRKFYGKAEDPELISHDNELFNKALRFGDEITFEQYRKGKHGSK
ncbi:MAG: hypothetical protein AB1427_21715 [Thermodesulfobacteriota bacterium]